MLLAPESKVCDTSNQRDQMDNFSQRLEQWRTRRKMSQDDLSRASGISKNYIQGLESGRKENPGMRIVEALAAALGIRPSVLIGDEVVSVRADARRLGEPRHGGEVQ